MKILLLLALLSGCSPREREEENERVIQKETVIQKESPSFIEHAATAAISGAAAGAAGAAAHAATHHAIKRYQYKKAMRQSRHH